MEKNVVNNNSFLKLAILALVQEKKSISSYPDKRTEYSENYNDYNDCHGDYYDADAN